MSTLERAIEIAALAHAEQTRFNGEPYILHPLRVMLAVETLEERQAAMLHDVIEKSPEWTTERLWSEGFSGAVVRAVEALSKRPGEDDIAFMCRAASDPIGRKVKYADLRDNVASADAAAPGAERERRLQKYREALKEWQSATRQAGSQPVS